MKKSILIIIMLIIMSNISGQLPQSMRSMATGEVFLDEWDNIFDPIELAEDDYLYFFTNLAELQYQYDDHLGGAGTYIKTRMMEEIPLGMAFENPFVKNLRHAVFVRFSHNFNSDTGGEYEEYSTTYSSNDQYYDTKVISYFKEVDYDDEGTDFDVIFNNSYQYNDMVLGLRFSSYCDFRENDNASIGMGLDPFDPYMIIDQVSLGEGSFEQYQEYYHFPGDELYFSVAEKGDFIEQNEFRETELLASMQFAEDQFIAGSSCRINLGYERDYDCGRDIDDSYEAEFMQVDEDSLIYEGDLREEFHYQKESDQHCIFAGGKIKRALSAGYNRDENFQELDLQFGYVFGSSKSGSSSQSQWQRRMNEYFPEDTVTYSEDYEDIVNRDGDYSGLRLNTHYRLNMELNEYADFGLGLWYDLEYLVHDEDLQEELLFVDSTIDGEGFDDELDVIATTTEYMTAEKQSIARYSNITLPIALEFKIDDDDLSDNDAFSIRNFVYRISSIFNYQYRKNKFTYNDIYHEPNITIIENGAGVLDIDEGNSDQLGSFKSEEKECVSSKMFAAGIGYRHSENVEIDFSATYDCETEDFLFGLSFMIRK